MSRAWLYCLGIPSMMLGLGVYLPFHDALGLLGAAVKIAYDRVASIRNARASGDATTNANTGTDETSHEEAPASSLPPACSATSRSWA
ncbi:MAG: hypothetical protein ACLTKG_06095 [Collinsella intestinalis]